MSGIIKHQFLLLILLGILLSSQHSAFAQPAPVKLDAHIKNQLAKLFDVFGRVCEVKYFREDKISEKDLLGFAILYNNNRGPYHSSDGSKYRLPAKYVDDVVMQFFGKHIKHHSYPGLPYRNGSYYAEGSDAGEYSRVEVINLLKLDSNTFNAYAAWYDDNNHVQTRERMTLKKVISSGKSRFVVLEYLKA